MNPTPSQLEAIEAVDRHVCVDAGAGSGKTAVIVRHIVHLLDKKICDLNEIVAITFTELAAGEMKDRLRKAFRDLAEDEKAMHSPDTMNFWRDLERRADTARVSTIHSFCGTVVRENAFRCGLDPDFTVLTDAETTLLKGEVIRRTIHDLLADNDEAALSIAAALGSKDLHASLTPLLNNRGLVQDMARQLPLGNADDLLAEWTRTAEELQKRQFVDVLQSAELRRLWGELKLFDGLCSKTCDQREVMRLQMVAALDHILIHDDVDELERMARGAADWKFTGTRASNWDSKETQEQVKVCQDNLRKLLKGAMLPETTPEADRETADLTAAFYHVYDRVAVAFQEAKSLRNALDFEDMILQALKLMADEKRGGVLDRLRRGIKHLLIDEFQDTDRIQLDIASRLASLGDDSASPKVFLVGDAKQSIYGFRGTEVAMFHKAKKTMQGDPIRLDTNFRSTPDVLAFVNHFFAASQSLKAVESVYRPLQWHRDPWSECRVEFLLTEENKDYDATAYRSNEADLIARRIVEMCNDDQGISVGGEDGPRGATYGDVAILFRSVSQLYLYERALQERGVPYVVESGPGYHKRQELVDLRNLLTVVANPWDELALLAFLRSPFAAISDDAILLLAQAKGLAQTFTSAHVPENFPEEARLTAARCMIADLRARAEEPLPLFLRYAIDRTGMEALWLSQFMGTQKAANVRKAIDMADAFSRDRAPRLPAFVRYLDELSVQEIREGEATMAHDGEGAVKILTVHKSKGLEFPIVILADSSAGVDGGRGTPVAWHKDLGLCAPVVDGEGKTSTTTMKAAIAWRKKYDELAENRRTLYVAMTRARDHLILSGSPSAKNVKKSWLGAFDLEYHISEMDNGKEFTLASGKGPAACSVTARVRWDVADLRSGDQSTPPPPPIDEQALRIRANPLALASKSRRAFSVTALAAAMTGKIYPPNPGHGRPSGGLNPLVRGTILHGVMEHWDFASPVGELLEVQCRKECPLPSDRPLMFDSLLPALEGMSQDPLIRRIAADEGVARENTFVWRLDDALVEGAIDVLLTDGTVIDYKTGRMETTPVAHEAQVRLYAAAVRILRGQTPPEAHLYYVDAGRVHTMAITDSDLDAAIDEALEAMAKLRSAQFAIGAS
jgi:ATP-dependent helicase/nuclease subunit A